MDRRTVSIVGAIIVVGGLITFAGDLDPPPGPIQPTMKTLDQVRPGTPIASDDIPLTITDPGFYYFTENITAETDAITIEADGVTLDLMGFELRGGIGNGVEASNRRNVAIKSGTIANWQFGDGNSGVGISAGGSVNVQLSDLRFDSNGIGVTGLHCVIRDCSASNNSLGFNVARSTLTRCVATDNDAGIAASESTVSHCLVQSNVIGIVTGRGGIVRDCVVQLNSSVGILTFGGAPGESLIFGNVVTGGGFGIQLNSDDNRVEENLLVDNETGIWVPSERNLIIGNSASKNIKDYDIASGNSFGPIVNVAGVGDISSVPNTEHPWANFSLGCASGLTNCLGTCVDTTTDGANCGSCGNECVEGETCEEGKCQTP